MSNTNRIPPIVWMFIGIFIFEIARLFSIKYDWSNYICMIGVLIFIFSYMVAPKENSPSSMRTLITLLYATIIFMMLRGSIIGRTPILDGTGEIKSLSLYNIVRFFLVNPYSALAILFPFVIRIQWKREEFVYYGKFAITASVLSLLMLFVFREQLLQAMTSSLDYALSRDISIRSIISTVFVGWGFILLASWTYSYFKSKKYILCLITLFSFFICSILGGGRGGSVSSFAYILIFFYFLRKNDSTSSHKKINSGVVILLAFFIIGVYFLYTSTNAFDYLTSRSFVGGDTNAGLKESTREEFVEYMISDFNNHPLCWLFGRGVNGAFLLNGNIYRQSIEWGYLWLILKGGIIYLLLYVIILIKSFIKGFRHSNNKYAKALGMLCLVQVLLLIPFGLPTVSIQCLLVWHSVRMLNSDEFISMSDDEIQQLLTRS